MYVTHGWAKTPTDQNVSIWRYFRLDRFMDFVEHAQAHFARLDQFPDQFEGVLPSTTVSLPKDGFRNKPRNPEDTLTDFEMLIRDINRIGKLCTYANCWYTSEYESEAMWRLFGANGVAIRSSFARLCASFSEEMRSVYIGEMRYLDFRSEQPPTYGNTLAIAYYKRREFEHEREIRAVVVECPEDYQSGSPPYDTYQDIHPRGLKIATDLNMLIDGIVLAPGYTQAAEEQVSALMKQHGLDKPIMPSTLDDLPTLI